MVKKSNKEEVQELNPEKNIDKFIQKISRISSKFVSKRNGFH